MLSGIIGEAAQVIALQSDKGNLHLTMKCSFVNELKIDQSVTHNGACLTVVGVMRDMYTVIVVKETLERSNFRDLKVDDKVNLERSVLTNGHLDGHIVQRHVDQIAACAGAKEANGGWYCIFEYTSDEGMARRGYVTVEKDSICMNGVSLTVCNSQQSSFQATIISYTHDNTNLCQIEKGTVVNLELDIIERYIGKVIQSR